MIPVAEPFLGEIEKEYVVKALDSGYVSSQGCYVKEFEQAFANYIGTNYSISTCNGTAALHLALSALEVSGGDEVIIPSLTFVATASAVMYCGAKPVFVDIHPKYWCIDPGKIEDRITSKTKAIIPVHLYGNPCDMEAILGIANKYGIYINEDAAESHGALYNGKKVGGFGQVSCFSFYGNKIITTGEGGMCLTNDSGLAEEMRLLRDHGMDPNKKYWHSRIGFNYRMTNLQAALGVAQLTKIDQIIEKKRLIAGWYNKGLRHLQKKNLINLHPEMPWASSVFWMYSILLLENAGLTRDQLIYYLRDHGIETRPFFYPITSLPPYKHHRDSSDHSQNIAARGLNLPSSPNITKADVEYIINTIDTCLHQ